MNSSRNELQQLIAHFSLKERCVQAALAQLHQRYRQEQENKEKLLLLIKGLEQQIHEFECCGLLSYIALNERRRKQAIYRKQIPDIRVRVDESSLLLAKIADDIDKSNKTINNLKKKVIKFEQYSKR
ncbi:hypothetical protein [Morganella sp. GD04133]|uniref:hypothetical protein n=1 Tax=Morganella sp. GD04133 TaxID=2975435 RepID=UPI0024472355|nr:hypothetical protein [Morganella sp. GD04133]MDH0353783.1 hypothetical protein [Morganella sp. GD04133]